MGVTRVDFDGTWSDFTYDLLDQPIESARRIQRDDGADEFVVQASAEGSRWELHLRRRGAEYHGLYRFVGEDDGYPVVMRLYHADGEDELLLLGTWKNPGVETTRWSILLAPVDHEADEADEAG